MTESDLCIYCERPLVSDTARITGACAMCRTDVDCDEPEPNLDAPSVDERRELAIREHDEQRR